MNKKNNYDNIEDMYSELLKDAEEQDEKEAKLTKKKKSISTISILGIILLLAVLSYIFMNRNNKPIEPNTAPTVIEENNTITVDTENSIYPSGTPEWAKKSAPREISEKHKEEVVKYMTDKGIDSYVSHVPSSKNGFTSDPKDKFDADGILPNHMYTEITQEELIYFTGDSLMRLINPVYGDWVSYQFLENKKLNANDLLDNFKDILSNKLLEDAKKDLKKEFPIKIDWDNNNQKMKIKEAGNYFGWIGAIDKIKLRLDESMTKGTVTSIVHYQNTTGGVNKNKVQEIEYKIEKIEGELKVTDINWKEV